MCYAPNLIKMGKFKGGLKTYYDNGGDDKTLKYMIEKGYWQLCGCGQCLECRIRYAANWAARCELENLYYENSYFITLTYDDEHLPIFNRIEETEYHGLVNPLAYYGRESDIHVEQPILCKADLQKFLKRLRITAERQGLNEEIEIEPGIKKGTIRYFACGEYGGQNKRPHYHLIVYGLKIPDLKQHYQKGGYFHFKSEWLSKIWGNGLVDIGDVSYKSARYVAQYIIKKQKGQAAEFYKEMHIPPEFVNMSLKPGIGEMYWAEHKKEIYDKDLLLLADGRKQKPPKYFDILMDRYCSGMEPEPEKEETELVHTGMESAFMRDVKQKRSEAAAESWLDLQERTGLTVQEYYEVTKQKYEDRHKLAVRRDKIAE